MAMMNKATMRKALRSKTIWFSILLAALPIIPTYIGEFDLTPIQQMLVVQAIAVIVAILRFVTDKPISDK